MSLVGEAVPATDSQYGAKTRYRQPDARCVIATMDRAHCDIAFAEPQWAPTPGQYLVLYQGEVCLGGGVIQ